MDFLDGLVTIAGSGDAADQHGVAVHVYRANRPMENRYFYDADGELMLVPQEGAIALATEFGRLEVKPGEITVISRGTKFQVVPAGPSRGHVCENFGPPFRLPELGPIGSQGLAQKRDFLAPVAAYEDRAGPCQVVAKFMGALWTAERRHSPLDVVAWHGNYTPYAYDLGRFMAINTVSVDHPDPSIFTVLSSPYGQPGIANCDFVVFPAALDGGRAHLPPAVVPSQRDERADGADPRRVRREGRGVPPRRHLAAQHHQRPSWGDPAHARGVTVTGRRRWSRLNGRTRCRHSVTFSLSAREALRGCRRGAGPPGRRPC